jgi:hypothetical protein
MILYGCIVVYVKLLLNSSGAARYRGEAEFTGGDSGSCTGVVQCQGMPSTQLDSLK